MRHNGANVAVLTTGGTIAGLPQTDVGYRAAGVSPQALLASVPYSSDRVHITVHGIADVGSQDIDHEIWTALTLKLRVLLQDPKIDGIVITHGTDTIEETAYLLHLTTNAHKPVVLTGAMKPPHAPGADGAANLRDAIVLASHPQAKPLGICVLMNQTIFSAQEVEKFSTSGLDAFSSRNYGPLGSLSGQELILHKHQTTNTSSLKTTNSGIFSGSKLTGWPRVPIMYAYAAMEPEWLDSILATQPDGIVVAGMGNGNLNQHSLTRLQEAAHAGLPVVRATRCARGYVTPNLEVDDARCGFITAGALAPQKARILLMLALQNNINQNALKQLF